MPAGSAHVLVVRTLSPTLRVTVTDSLPVRLSRTVSCRSRTCTRHQVQIHLQLPRSKTAKVGLQKHFNLVALPNVPALQAVQQPVALETLTLMRHLRARARAYPRPLRSGIHGSRKW